MMTDTSGDASRRRKRVRLSDLSTSSGYFHTGVGGPRIAIRASYDAAQTTPENHAHWAGADHLSANSSATPYVRAILRARSRYERANNCYCAGMLLTVAQDVVGIGPRVQILRVQRDAANEIERKFMDHIREIRLSEKLRTMIVAKKGDGEVFGVKFLNRNLRSPVKLDLRLLEGDQVATPDIYSLYTAASASRRRDEPITDGIVYDEYGNPQYYHVLTHHPGETMSWRSALDMEPVVIAAEHVTHLFRRDRPGQTRGIPEITPALPLYAHLRRFTLAVIRAAENQALLTGVIKSTLPPEPDAESFDPMDTVELERGMWTMLPEGHDIAYPTPQQPVTTYGDFKREIINEIARCINVPFNVAAGISAKYNYASGRLDHQLYFRSLRIERDTLEREVLDWFFNAWLEEASRIPGYLPIPDADATLDREWYWDGFEHVDPAKEALGQQIRLTNHTTTLAAEYARQGRDWETELRQRAKEIELTRQLGLMDDSPAAAASSAGDVDDNDDDGGDTENAEDNA